MLAFIVPPNAASPRRARFAPGSHCTRQTGSQGRAAAGVPSRESAHGLFYGDSDPLTRGTGSLGYCLSALYPKTQIGVCWCGVCLKAAREGKERWCVGCNSIASTGFPVLFLHKNPYVISFPFLSCIFGGL